MGAEGRVELRDLTTLHVGGPCRRLLAPGDTAGLVEAVRTCDAAKEPVLLLGGGSNLVVDDAGFPGTVVRVATRGLSVGPEGPEHVRVVAAAGEPWDDLVDRSVTEGWSGLEALSGIPGLVGATPVQNVGAYGQEVAQTLVGVRAYDRRQREVVELSAADCGFGYRTSRFKRADRWVVLAVTFRLERSGRSSAVGYAELARVLGVRVGERAEAPDVRSAVLRLRRSKGMVLDPADPDTASVGSFFTNPVVSREVSGRLPDDAPRFPQTDGRVKTSAAWLVERAGFARGYGHGDARISSKHTLALINRGSATTGEVVALAREIRDGVRRAFGVELAAEPRLVGCRL